MLSDEQIDSLERLIVFSTMDQLPLVLSRAIPVLFSELRLVKATLDSKVNHFLEGIQSDDRTELHATEGEGVTGDGPSGLGEEGVPVGPERMGIAEPVRPTAVLHRGQEHGGGHPEAEGGTAEVGPHRKRNRRGKGRDQVPLDGRGGESAVGGPLPIEPRVKG